MLDLNKPVQTRDGHPARIICTDFKHPVREEFCIVAASQHAHGEVLNTYTKEGKLHAFPSEHHLDLINVPEKVSGYLCVFEGGRTVFLERRIDADRWLSGGKPAIARIKIEYTIGQFDD